MAFGVVFRGGPLINGIQFHMRVMPARVIFHYVVLALQKDGAICEPWSKFLPGTNSASALVLYFSISKLKNSVLLYLSPQNHQ